ncbi:MAG: hypothetical protein NW701_08610 [Nitrospira sp.]
MPSLVIWNRLEPQPRTNDLSVALRVEVRDALWMLARQWQMGEFRAEDAGTCAFVKVQCESVFAQQLSLKGGQPRACSPETPLNFSSESIAPVETHSPAEGAPPALSLDLRVELGRYWLRLLKSKLPAGKANAAIKTFKATPLLHFRIPATETTEAQAAHAATLVNQPYVQMLGALSNGRALDGWQLFRQLQTQKASNFLPRADGAVDQLGEDFKKWVTDKFPPLAQSALSGWHASRLEYQFDCAVAKDSAAPTILRVPEHDGSRLDWHTFEQNSDAPSPVHPDLTQPMPHTEPVRRTAMLLPRAVSFAGAPRNRWWEMEDSTMDLTNLRPSATDPAQLVLAEFALLFSNDWLSIPLDVPAGSLNRLSSLMATDVFGEVTMLLPTPQDENWGLFSVAGKTASALWLPPVAGSVTQSPAKEEVLLLRDEMANLAWGIENVIPDGLGGGRDGLEAADELRRWLDQLLGGDGPSQPDGDVFADRRYVLGTSVPENWIPFVPVRFDQNGQLRLRRAALPRTIAGRPPVRIRPRTGLLREGLESSEVQPFDLNEEEITMPGIVVRQFWRQARWFDGKIFTWLAREKMYARPARASGLRFDSAAGHENP